MLYEGLQYGLQVQVSDVSAWGSPEYNSSMTPFWRILEVFPFRRLTYKDRDSTERWSANQMHAYCIQS